MKAEGPTLFYAVCYPAPSDASTRKATPPWEHLPHLTYSTVYIKKIAYHMQER